LSRLLFLVGFSFFWSLFSSFFLSVCGCGFFLCQFLGALGLFAFWFWGVFCLLFGCGVGGFCLTSMLVFLVVGDGGYDWLWEGSKASFRAEYFYLGVL
jgi:hypothetical protein